jgi:hypothetical protein
MAGDVGHALDTPVRPTGDGRDAEREQYENQLAERLALLLVAGFRRRVEEQVADATVEPLNVETR